MKKGILKAKSFEFAVRIVKLYKHLSKIKNENILSKQLLRSGTSIGANLHEAEHAESKADFIHKLSISLEEANESVYWIDLLYQTNFLEESLYQSVLKANKELVYMLISGLKTLKSKK